jgi:hypothetical protein
LEGEAALVESVLPIADIGEPRRRAAIAAPQTA